MLALPEDDIGSPSPAMINNDVLRSVRFMLNTGESGLANIIQLGGGTVSPARLTSFLKREDEPGFELCDNALMAHFLDGLIIHRRGPDPSGETRPVEKSITTNTVLKKLRVAFALKEGDIVELMKNAGFEVSRPELSALFRNPGHHNFRPCGDQFLRNFLKGLTARIRVP